MQLLGAEVEVVDGVGADVGAAQHGRRAELGHHVELGAEPVQHGVEPLGRHALDVAHRLEEVDAQAEVGAPGRDLARRQRRGDQVVVEDLDARRSRRPRSPSSLSASSAAERDGGDALLHHGAVSSAKCRDIRSASGTRPVKCSNAPTAWCTAMPPPGTTRQPRVAGQRGPARSRAGSRRRRRPTGPGAAAPSGTAEPGVAEHPDRGRVDDAAAPRRARGRGR